MDLHRNAERFTGKDFIERYHKNRPEPPTEIIHQTLNYANTERPNLIVDLGCGTGISTRVWSDYANQIIGIEPSSEMMAVAENKTKQSNIVYKNTFSDNTEMSSKSVAIVTCSQSFHWMEPESTLHEIDRILEPGGVLVVYDVIWPPSVNYQYEAAYSELFENIDQLTKSLDEEVAYRWNRSEHLANIKNSGHFKFCKESYYHKTESLDKNKFIGIALSQGGLETLLKKGFTEKELGLDIFREKIHTMRSIPFSQMTYHYKAVYAVK